MSSSAGAQLDLLGAAAPEPKRVRSRALLGILLEQQDFLLFLSSEWLFPAERGQLFLGVGRACSPESEPPATSVAVWFDAGRLPDVTLMAWRGAAWERSPLAKLHEEDEAVAWNGPLPLFAVKSFTVASSEVRAHLLAMVRGFADMDLPEQPVEVDVLDCCQAPRTVVPSTSPMVPPRHWDALRGAAALAAWSVPAIDPWLDLLCDSLASDAPNPKAENVRAPWWRSGLWSCSPDGGQELPPLWRAIISELSKPGTLREWRPKSILEAVCVRARAFGADETSLERLSRGALALLDDRGTIEEAGLLDDHLGLTLQLLLLRPSPERFVTWREDWPAIPPGVWWTGMTLAGYLQGFRALPKQWRGSLSARRLLALRTWKLACAGHAGVWNDMTTESLDWVIEGEAILLRADKKPWAEHKVGTRGIWYRADLADPVVAREAEALVAQAQPSLMKQVLVLKDASLPFVGDGSLKVEPKKRLLTAKGQVELDFSSGMSTESRLDAAGFRLWMATASVTQRIRRPSTEVRHAPEPSHHVAMAPATVLAKQPARARSAPKVATKEQAAPKRKPTPCKAPSGLTVLPDFITADEERSLLETIDAQTWDTSMKRKVQHYGWRYDYKFRKVDPSAFLGELPPWVLDLAYRLMDSELVDELPDQVIVNNYEGAQGITRHIDCPECFRGAVVTISLNEAWEMVFTRKRVGHDAERFPQVLPRRSAAVLAGEARSSWFHEIPERQKEGRVPRGRRVSITFRKVDTKP